MHVKTNITVLDRAHAVEQTQNLEAGTKPESLGSELPSGQTSKLKTNNSDTVLHPLNGVAVSAPSTHPSPRSSGLNRDDFTDPDLARPALERETSKQTIIPIRKPKTDFFRIHPAPETRLSGVTVLLTKNGKPKILTNRVSQEIRSQLPREVLKKMDLYFAADERGSYFVTYFSASDHENAESWRESGFIVVNEAERDWISIDSSMQEGGYRISYARDKYPKLAASRPKWELPGEDDPIALFEATINQNRIDSDNSPSIQKFLETRR